MNQSSLRAAARISLGLLVILLIGAIVFYKMRMLFVDAPGIAFTIINQKTLAIQEHRYGSFITQAFPLAGAWLHLPLKVILLLYSASFNFFYLSVAFVLYRFKEYGLVILTAFYFTLFVSDTYFWTNNEVHQGIAWMLLMFGTLLYMERRQLKTVYTFPVFILMAFLAIFTHPLIMLATGFLWIFLWLEGRHAPFIHKYRSLQYTLALAAIIGIKFYLSQHGWYDSGKLHNVTHTTLPKVLATFKSGLADTFWHQCLENYWLLLLLFIIGLVYLLKEKKYMQASWTVLCALGYFVLICLTYYEWTTFYIESEWMIISIIGTAAFVFYVLPRIKANQAVWLMVFIFSVRMAYICRAIPTFQNRVAILQLMLDKMSEKGINKAVIVRKDERLERLLIMAWNTAPETLFLSALNGDKPFKTAVQVYEHELGYKIPNNNRDFMNSFYNIPYKDIDGYYFHIDTTQPYRALTYDELLGE